MKIVNVFILPFILLKFERRNLPAKKTRKIRNKKNYKRIFSDVFFKLSFFFFFAFLRSNLLLTCSNSFRFPGANLLNSEISAIGRA
jgi:hypothetical protein